MLNRFIFCAFLLIALLGSSCNSNGPLYHDDFIEGIEEIYLIRSWQYADQVKQSLDSIYAVHTDLGPVDKKKYYQLMSWYYRTIEQPDSSILYVDSALYVLTGLKGYEGDYVKMLNTKAVMLKKKGHFNEALKVLYGAGQFAENQVDKCTYSHALANLGNILFKQGSYYESIKYYHLAERNALKCDSANYVDYFIPLQSFYNAIGLCYELSNNMDSAFVYYQKGLDFIAENRYNYKDKHQEFINSSKGVLLGNFANAKLKAGEIEEARAKFKASIGINVQENGELGDGLFTLIKLGRLYLQESAVDSAFSIIQQIEESLTTYKNFEVAQRLRKFSRDYHLHVGDSLAALRSHLEYTKARDSSEEASRELKNLEFSSTFNLLEQKEELENLRAEKELYLTYIAFAILIGLVLLSSIVVYRKNLRKSRKHADDLRQLNQKIVLHHERLQRAMIALEESNEQNKHIMKVLAHDLRSPIGSMLSIANLIKEEGHSADLEEYTSMIVKLGEDSLGFIMNLLNVKDQTAKGEKELVEIFDLVEYCVSMMQYRAEEKRQKITISGVTQELFVYREMVWRVVNNLLANAMKFSPQNARIVVSIQEKDQGLEVAVKDEGVGIPERDLGQIFNLDHKGNREGTDGERSFGLGLAISKQIMEAHDGKISVESEEGKGTSVFLWFPLNSKNAS